MKNKKITLPLIALGIFLLFFLIGVIQYRLQGTSFLETIPLLPQRTPTPAPARPTGRPAPLTPKQTDIDAAISSIDDETSLNEKAKFSESLPVRINNFATSVGIKTTINIYLLESDPPSSVRLEIYGINYNDQGIEGKQAIAFKESFLKAKEFLVSKQVILKDLQIIYGNRQYIQDTATYWVKTFGLLN